MPTAPAGGKDAATGDKPGAATNSVLSLSDLEAIAVESNPSLVQLAFVVEKARGIHEQVGLYPNPVVGYSANEIGNEGAAGQQGGFIAQTIVTADKLRLNRDVASWNVQELSWEYQAQRYRILNDVRLRYYDVLGAQQRLKIAGELLKVAENGVKIAEQLRKAKQASRADVLQATVDLNQIQIIRQNAKYDYQAAWKRLVAVLGRPEIRPATLAGSLKGAAADWQWGPTYQKLVDESPQIQAARSRIQGARLAIQRQEAQPIPNLLTQAGVQFDNSTGDTITSVQIGIPLPIYNRNQGIVRLARAEYQRAVRDAERLELQLRDRLATAFRDFQQAKFQVQQYQKNILSNAQESRKLTEESYRAGQVNFLRVLTARRTYFEANLLYVDALIALRQANVVIDGFVLTGGLTDVPNIGSRVLKSIGQRGQALGGQ
ncbi:MAG: TolC family protein [Planctomycetaceae bacterium]